MDVDPAEFWESRDKTGLADQDVYNVISQELYINDEYCDKMFVNSDPVNHDELVELYVNKTKKGQPKDNVIIDPGVLEKVYEPYELMFAYLMRLNLRWSKEEVEFLEKESNTPVTLFDQDGGSKQRWLSISQCQRLIKAWRNTRTPENPIVSDEQLVKLEQLAQDSLKGHVNVIDSNFVQYIYFTQEHLGELPNVQGCLVNKSGEFLAYPITLDTAASSSILPYSYFKAAGYSDSDLDKGQTIVIATACSSNNKAMGTFKTQVFLKSANGRFYSILVNFLVLKTDMKRILLGIVEMRMYQSVWNSSGTQEKFLLWVRNSVNKKVRKSFICNASGQSGRLDNEDPKVTVGIQPTTVNFVSTSEILFTESEVEVPKSYKLHSVKEGKSSVEWTTENKVRWPTAIKYVYQLELSTDKTKPLCASLKVNPEKPPLSPSEEEEILCEAFQSFDQVMENEAQPSMGENDLEDLENIPLVPDLNKFALDMTGVGPPDPEVEVDEFWYLPDMSSLDDYWKEKYTKLFSHFRDVFSKTKYDFVQSNLDPVDIELKDDSKPAFDRVRRYGVVEMLLIDEYIDNLVKAGHVRELTETTSPYNHCLVLVYRQNPDEKVFISSKADRANLSNEDRLELLRKSSRLCADMRSLNKQCKSAGGMHLSRFSEILPAFSHRVLSSLDIKSGYNILKLTKESSMYTAFVHRNKQYIWLTLPQGLAQSPSLFVRRLSTVLSDKYYTAFSKEMNQRLEDRQHHELLIYDCDARGQTACSQLRRLKEKNPQKTYTDLALENENKILEEYEYSRVLIEGLHHQIEAYLDDVLCLSGNNLDHYYIVYFVMYVFYKYKIKIASKKFQLVGENITYLGYDINTKKNEYGLTVSRRKNFENWLMPTTRSALVSRLCIGSYFSNVILSFKVITQCLSYLAKTKGDFRIQEIHRREFEMMKLCIELCCSFAIPDLRYPQILSSDASFSAISGTIMQWVPDKISESESENVKSAVNKGTFSLQLVGQFSKRLSGTDPNKSPLYKELVACLATLREYENYIRNSSSFSLLFSDASSLSMVTKLKHVNSRLHTFAMYLSSFPTLHVIFTPSSRLNFLCDYITKIYCGKPVKTVEAIPQKYLENIDNIKVKKNTLVTPETLHAILQSPIPEFFTNIPERRKQAFDPLFDYGDFEKLMSQRPVEEQFLKGLMYGLETMPQDSVAYQRTDKKGIVTKEEYNKMYNKCSGDQIKEHFKGLLEHSVHITEFEEISGECKEWVKILDHHLNGALAEWEPDLKKQCAHYLQLPTKKQSLGMFRNVVNTYQASSLYNSNKVIDEYFPTLFVLVEVCEDSPFTLQNINGSLVLNCNTAFTIAPQRMYSLSVQMTIFSKYVFTISSIMADRWIFYPKIRMFQEEMFIEQILLFNDSDQPLHVRREQEMFRVNCHRVVKDECHCKKNQQVKYLVSDFQGEWPLHRPNVVPGRDLTKQNFEVLYSEDDHNRLSNPSADLKLSSMDHVNNPMVKQFLVFLSETVNGVTSDYRLPVVKPAQRPHSVNMTELLNRYEEEYGNIPISDSENSFYSDSSHLDLPQQYGLHLTRSKKKSVNDDGPKPIVSPEAHNSMVVAGLLLQRNECFTPALVKSLQETCPYLSEMKKKVIKDGASEEFRLTKGVLFKKNKWNNYVLCLDKVSFSFMVQAVHETQRHYGDQMMFVYLSSYFFAKDMKQIIQEQRQKCFICVFNQRCGKVKYVNRPSQNGPLKVFSRVHTDVDEFWKTAPGSRKKYLCLFICAASGYVISYAMRRQTGPELCNVFNDLVKNMGVPQELSSDFGAMYRSTEFRELLQKYNVSHRKFCPKRSPEAGLAEVNIKEYRRTYMNLLLSECKADQANWDKYLPQASLIFNSQSLHANTNYISRFSLFFNSDRYKPVWLYSHIADAPLDVKLEQQLAFQKIHEKRENFRKHYNTQENTFLLGQYVTHPLGKDEFKTIDNSKSMQHTVQNIYEVMEIFPNSCRLKSIFDGGECTLDFGTLKALEPTQINNLFGKVLKEPGTFHKSLFIPGSRDGQLLKNIEELPSIRPDRSGPTQIEIRDDEEEEIDEVIPEDETSIENDDTDMSEAVDTDMDDGVVPVSAPHHPYNLRPRQKKNYTHLTEKRSSNEEILVTKVKFGEEIQLKEFSKLKPTKTALSVTEYYPCQLNHPEYNADEYIPQTIPLDPTITRREATLLLMQCGGMKKKSR